MARCCNAVNQSTRPNSKSSNFKLSKSKVKHSKK